MRTLLERDGPAALGSADLQRFNAYRQNPDGYPFATAAERDQFRTALAYEQYLRGTNPSLSPTDLQNLIFRNVPVSVGGGFAGVTDSVTAILRMAAAGQTAIDNNRLCESGAVDACVRAGEQARAPLPGATDLCRTISCLASARTAGAVTDVGLFLLPVASELNAMRTVPGLSAVARADVAALGAEARAGQVATQEVGAVGSTGAGTGVVANEQLAGSIRNVNPGFPIAGRVENCVNCAIATDSTLAGRPTVALPTNGPTNLRVLESYYGSRFGSATTTDTISQSLALAGNGARGIVFGSRGPGEVGHVFNVVNQNGVIRFLDGQTGRPAVLTGYQSFSLLRTN